MTYDFGAIHFGNPVQFDTFAIPGLSHIMTALAFAEVTRMASVTSLGVSSIRAAFDLDDDNATSYARAAGKAIVQCCMRLLIFGILENAFNLNVQVTGAAIAKGIDDPQHRLDPQVVFCLFLGFLTAIKRLYDEINNVTMFHGFVTSDRAQQTMKDRSSKATMSNFSRMSTARVSPRAVALRAFSGSSA